MKLKNKLLPLVGLGAVCATAIPLASCTKSAEESFVNLKEQYNPSIKQIPYSADGISMEDAIDTYFNNKDFSKTFIQDYYWNASTANYIVNSSKGSSVIAGDDDKVYYRDEAIQSNLPDNQTPIKMAQAKSFSKEELGFLNLPANKRLYLNSEIVRDIEKLSNVSLKKVDVQDGEEIFTIYCVSYDLEFEFELNSLAFIQQQSKDIVDSTDGSLKLTSKIKVTDMPMTLNYGTCLYRGVDQFYIAPNFDAMYAFNVRQQKPKLMWKMEQQLTYSIVQHSDIYGTLSSENVKNYLVGYREDGTTYHSDFEEAQYILKQNADFSANWFSSYYLYNCFLNWKK